MADRQPQKSVYILYDNSNFTYIQLETHQLVQNLIENYNGRCKISINRYTEDYIPGRSFIEEHMRMVEVSDNICVIMTKEAKNSKMFNYSVDHSLLNVIENDKRMVAIGVYIDTFDLNSPVATLNNRLYKTFSQVNVREDTFLDAIFLPAESQQSLATLPKHHDFPRMCYAPIPESQQSLATLPKLHDLPRMCYAPIRFATRIWRQDDFRHNIISALKIIVTIGVGKLADRGILNEKVLKVAEILLKDNLT